MEARPGMKEKFRRFSRRILVLARSARWRLRHWLIIKIVGDLPVMFNLDVYGCARYRRRTDANFMLIVRNSFTHTRDLRAVFPDEFDGIVKLVRGERLTSDEAGTLERFVARSMADEITGELIECPVCRYEQYKGNGLHLFG